jgi:predicted RNase H-like HicB family nuclease
MVMYSGEEMSASLANLSVTRYSEAVSIAKRRPSYKVLLERGEDGWIVATCADIKGAVSQGKSVDDALRNIVEAISLILEGGDAEGEFSVSWEEL